MALSSGGDRLLAGLLAVDPHRLYLYWDVSGLDGLTMSLQGGGAGWEQPRKVHPSGRLYVEGLPADRSYQAEFLREGELVLRSNEIQLPPDQEYLQPEAEEFAPAPPPQADLPSSASLLP